MRNIKALKESLDVARADLVHREMEFRNLQQEFELVTESRDAYRAALDRKNQEQRHPLES